MKPASFNHANTDILSFFNEFHYCNRIRSSVSCHRALADMASNTQRNYTYGIDFGTSNSSISIWDNQRNSVWNDEEVSRPEPTLLYFPHARSFYARTDERYFGFEAIDRYIGDNMDGRLLQAIKTILPDSSFTETIINNQTYTIEELVALHLRHLKRKADLLTGESGEVAVMGRPAVFHPDPENDKLAEDRLRTAARMVGFKSIEFQYEPIAAAWAYEASLTSPQVVLVGDFGGGTSDFTIIRLDPAKRHSNNRREDVLSTHGVPVAGNRLDSDVMWHKLTPLFGKGATYQEFAGAKVVRVPSAVHHTICRWDRIPFLNRDKKLMDKLVHFEKKSNNPEGFSRLITLIKRNLGFSVFQSIEKAKIGLSQADSAALSFLDPEMSIDGTLTDAEFREFTDDTLEQIRDSLMTTLSQAGMKADEVNLVFLTGGSSLVRPIQEIFHELFGQEKVRSGDTFTSVAQGLALSAPLFF